MNRINAKVVVFGLRQGNSEGRKLGLGKRTIYIEHNQPSQYASGELHSEHEMHASVTSDVLFQTASPV